MKSQAYPTLRDVKLRVYKLPEGGLEHILPDQEQRYRGRHAVIAPGITVSARDAETLVVVQWKPAGDEYFHNVPTSVRRKLSDAGARRTQMQATRRRVRGFANVPISTCVRYANDSGTQIIRGEEEPILECLIDDEVARPESRLYRARTAITEKVQSTVAATKYAFDRFLGPPGVQSRY